MPLPTFLNLPKEKQQKIIDCAIDEFAQHDYNSASISRVVSRTGIAKGSLYQYFEDKSDLYHYLLELAAQKKAELLANARPPDPKTNLFDTLHWLFREMAKYQILYPDLARIGYRAVYGKPPLPDDIVNNAAQSTRQYFADLIEAGKKRGEVRPEIDSGIAAFVFTAALAELTPFLTTQVGIHSVDLVTGEKYSNYEAEVEKIYNQIVTILQSGIAQS
jgi:AcrR family transcriptional regulator